MEVIKEEEFRGWKSPEDQTGPEDIRVQLQSDSL